MNSRSNLCFLACACALAIASSLSLRAAHEEKPADATTALARLKAGNERFTAKPVSTPKPVAERRAETAQVQHPFAIIVGCADSRTAPELVFDQNLGDLFVVRVAGNLVDDYALGSIEYGVEHLGARLIVVLGHERCGAVKAALGGATAPGHVGALVRDIQPAVAAAKKLPGDLLANAVDRNAADVAQRIRTVGQFGPLAREVRVVSACYDLDTGVVTWAKE